jgi:hypothetical protein
MKGTRPLERAAHRAQLSPAFVLMLTMVLAVPAVASASPRLLERDLAPPAPLRAVNLSLLADPAPAEAPAGHAEKNSSGAKKEPSAAGADLDFDLLGEAKAPELTAADRRMGRRRWMMKTHQAVGLGLLGTTLATTVIGQLNYNDRFGDSNTARYRVSHQVAAYTSLGLFAINGTLALLAPDPPRKVSRGWDRTTLHKIAMATAAVGMLAQGGLGIYTARRDGYENQQDFGRMHLAVGYATIAAVAAGAAVMIF